MKEVKSGFYTKRTQASKFTSVPIELLTADTAVIHSTGEEIKITDTLLRVYLYMRNQYCRSLDSKSSEGYYEGWESIASAVGKSKDLFKKGTNQPNLLLIKLGLLELTKFGKGRSDMKVVKDIVAIYDEVSFLNTKASDYKERKTKEREAYLKSKKEDTKPVVDTPATITEYNKPVISHDCNGWEFDDDSVPF